MGLSTIMLWTQLYYLNRLNFMVIIYIYIYSVEKNLNKYLYLCTAHNSYCEITCQKKVKSENVFKSVYNATLYYRKKIIIKKNNVDCYLL